MQSLIRPKFDKPKPLYYFHYYVGMKTPVGVITRIRHSSSRYYMWIETPEWIGKSGELYEILQNSRERKDTKDNK